MNNKRRGQWVGRHFAFGKTLAFFYKNALCPCSSGALVKGKVVILLRKMLTFPAEMPCTLVRRVL